MTKLSWVHILIGDIKSFISGACHGVSHKHLQPYLNEFYTRFNEFQMTGRLLSACLASPGITDAELTQ